VGGYDERVNLFDSMIWLGRREEGQEQQHSRSIHDKQIPTSSAACGVPALRTDHRKAPWTVVVVVDEASSTSSSSIDGSGSCHDDRAITLPVFE
jgi:hypothetical protein